MKFIRTKEEVEKILGVVADPEFLDSEMLVVTFRTTEEFVKEVLPPPLEACSRTYWNGVPCNMGKEQQRWRVPRRSLICES